MVHVSRQIPPAQQFLGPTFFVVPMEGWTSLPRSGGFQIDLRIARAEDLVAGAGRVAKDAVKDTVGKTQKKQQETRM